MSAAKITDLCRAVAHMRSLFAEAGNNINRIYKLCHNHNAAFMLYHRFLANIRAVIVIYVRN